jgi:hypothetical protein
MTWRREGTEWITTSQHPQGDEAGSGVHGQQFTRLETKPLCPTGQLEEVGHTARLAADLENVATLHAGRGDLYVGGQCAAGCPPPHGVTSVGAPRLTAVWHEQSQAS